ncbi:glycosyltransferase family 9 protein [Massilia sp. CMS3.1]|uniref:glycosyltransferase family 9 protein n=1 Tax=Massilia sp. CMS3.1 TaxID=3373083 RepID=UPI003EE43E06
MTTMTDWNDARHLLCVQLRAPGDVLTCTPALRALRAQCPGRRLTLLASAAGAALAPYLPDVDAVLAFDAPWTEQGAAASPASHLGSIARLAAQGFDGAVIFTRCSDSALPAALLCQLAGIALRAAWCRENPTGLLTHPIADPEPGAMLRHPVQRHLDLVRRLGAEIADERLAFVPLEMDLAAVRRRLRTAGIDPSRRWLALHPGAGAQARRYPQRHWSSLIRALHERIGCPLVLTGGAHEQALIDAIDIPAGARVHSLAGQLDIGALGALLAQASLVVSNNPESVQLAAAVGTPIVSLQALTDAQHTPWRVPGRVLNGDVECPDCERSVCHHDCVESLAPARVVDAVCSLLKQTEAYRAREVALE